MSNSIMIEKLWEAIFHQRLPSTCVLNSDKLNDKRIIACHNLDIMYPPTTTVDPRRKIKMNNHFVVKSLLF